MATEHHGPPVHLHFDLDSTLAETEAHIMPSWLALAADTIRNKFRPDLSEEEIRSELFNGYQQIGCSLRGVALRLNLPASWPDEFYAHESLLLIREYAPQLPLRPDLGPKLELVAQVARLSILTQAHQDYTEYVLGYLGLRANFSKVRHRAYKRTEHPFQAIMAEEGHHEAQHWLIEDSPANLPMAKRYGFTTVLVGSKEGEADYRFALVEDFLDAYLTNGLPSG